MIDMSCETLVPLSQVPKLLPPRSNGKRLHISAVYRWAQRGVRGVKLESIRIGGTTYTSREALQRFAEGNHTSTQAVRTPASPTQRRRQAKVAAQRVQEILGTGYE